MVIVYRPYVSRWRRAWNIIKEKPRFWLKNYPEFFAAWCIMIPTAIIGFSSRLYIAGKPNYYGMGWCEKPYYREFYEVRRPNDPMALKWRLPEEYPAYFVTNRQADDYPSTSYKKHYAWDVK